MSDLLITRKNTHRIGFHSVLLPLLIINITIFANVIGELTALLFHYLFCRVVIGQCDRTVGCNRTPVIGQMKQPIKCLPFPTKMCKLKEIGEKDFFFLLLIIFFFCNFGFFSFVTSFFDCYFSFYPCTILLSINDFFKTRAISSICELLLRFVVDC